MTGAAIQRQKIAMPKRLQSLGTANTELEGRFKTSFDLLAKDNELSSKPLENELKGIRDKLTSSLGKDRGRVLLVRNKAVFLEEIAALEMRLSMRIGIKLTKKALQPQAWNKVSDAIVTRYTMAFIPSP